MLDVYVYGSGECDQLGKYKFIHKKEYQTSRMVKLKYQLK